MVQNSSSGGADCIPDGWNTAAKPCDICMCTVALIYCRKDTVFLCMACDVKLHNHTKHERVWMCEVCEMAPAYVTCKADAATLCVTCDRDIHSANPLARRHERIPVIPFYDSTEAIVNSASGSLLDAFSTTVAKENDDSWGTPVSVKSIDALFSVGDPFFDFGFAIPTGICRFQAPFDDLINEAVVPIETTLPMKNFPPAIEIKSPLPLEIDITRSTNSYSNRISQSHSHSVCTSSMNVGVVPEQKLMLEKSDPFTPLVNSGGINYALKSTPFSAVDREARVLRYREKKKNRKFQKQIRYASRKAYAEKRPRIKGRFVKRTELTTELDVDRWLFTAESNSNCYGSEVQYGVVPSF